MNLQELQEELKTVKRHLDLAQEDVDVLTEAKYELENEIQGLEDSA